MVVIYYTSTSFMDVILETIQSIKHRVTLHVVIEISTQNKNATIINVNSLEGLNAIEDPEKVLGKEQWELFKPYFEGVASVKFVVHQKKQSLSWHSLQVAYKLGKYLKKLKADIFHFDTISPRAIGLFPYLTTKKVVIALHDPVPHPGEDNWREDVPIYVFFRLAKAFVFYSDYATGEFKKYYPKVKAPLCTIKLQPYTFLTYYKKPDVAAKKGHILFFGRLSYYKGIDILVDAIPSVLASFPDEKFIIAGKPVFGYEVDLSGLSDHKDHVEVISRFLSTEELVSLIEGAKCIVCPYREATQSGVVMSAFAVGKPVIATNVGSFAEFIEDGKNGLLADPNAASLAEKIKEALHNNHYLALESGVASGHPDEARAKNGENLVKAYESALR